MQQTSISIQVIASILLLSWLVACMAFDLRSRLVPTWLTVLPLVAAGTWRFIQGGWVIVLLVIGLILISDLPQEKWRIPIACLASALGLSQAENPDTVYAMLVVFVVWALWEIGAMGGADAKVIITLVLFLSNGLLFIPIVLVGGIQGLVALIANRKTIPYTVAIALGTTAWLFLASYL